MEMNMDDEYGDEISPIKNRALENKNQFRLDIIAPAPVGQCKKKKVIILVENIGNPLPQRHHCITDFSLRCFLGRLPGRAHLL